MHPEWWSTLALAGEGLSRKRALGCHRGCVTFRLGLSGGVCGFLGGGAVTPTSVGRPRAPDSVLQCGLP